MSTTLTNGLKLPDKGSVDWYADMQNNYTILDGAVGTVADHTTALAGKAPLVHTHTVSQITDFPAYGTTAGTICEGNDSRLSDARTPLSHTHTKSDVTDLLNSNFIPSANNSYDLGSSSYQWNNLYAKNYYYNGVAWGLDKANVWTGDNTFSNILKQVNSTVTKGTNPQSDTTAFGVYWGGTSVSSLNNALYVQRLSLGADGSTTVFFYALENVYGGTHTSLILKYDPNDTVNERSIQLRGDLRPSYNNEFNLGTSTNKWKTLNGINPGGLSLPNVRAAVADPVDTVNWSLTGSRNTYTPTEDGWFFIRVAGTGSCAINIHTGGSGNDYPTWFNSSTGGYATLVVPVEKSITLYIYITATSIEYCSFRPCLGNV